MKKLISIVIFISLIIHMAQAQEAFTCEDAIIVDIGSIYLEPPPGGWSVNEQDLWLKMDKQTNSDLYFEYREYGWYPLEIYKGEDCSNLELIQKSSNSFFVHFKNLEKGSYYIKFLRHGKPGPFLIDTIPGLSICSEQITDDLQELPEGYFYNTSYGQDSAYLHWYDRIEAYYKCPCNKRSINEKKLLLGENKINWRDKDFNYPIEYDGTAIFNFIDNNSTWLYKIGICSNYQYLRSNPEDKTIILPGLNQDDTLFIWGIQPAAVENKFFFCFKKPQEIIFNQPPDLQLSAGPISLPKVSSTGLPIHYEILSGNASVQTGLLQLIAPGPITIKASQPGNETYDSAQSITHTFCINPDKPVITLNQDAGINLTSSNPEGNQWYRNGKLIKGATERMLKIDISTNSENYTVISDIEGCQSKMSDIFTATSLIDDVEAIVLYPNPAVNYLTIPVNEVINVVGVQVYDSEGQFHHTPWKTNIHLGKGLLEIDTSSLPAGVYILKIKENDANTSFKFLKN